MLVCMCGLAAVTPDAKRKSLQTLPDPESGSTKVAKFVLDAGTKKLIAADTLNKKLWGEAVSTVAGGSKVSFNPRA